MVSQLCLTSFGCRNCWACHIVEDCELYSESESEEEIVQQVLILSKQSDTWCLCDLIPLNVQVLEHFIQEA